MNSSPFKWIMALMLSFGIHASLAGFYREPAVEIKIAGGSSVDMASLGDAFSDSIASGEPNEVIEPITPDVSELLEAPNIEPLRAPSEDNIETITPMVTKVIPETSPTENTQLSSIIPTEPIPPVKQPVMESVIDEPAISIVPIPQSRIANTPKQKKTKQTITKKKPVAKKVTKPSKKEKKQFKTKKQKVASGNRGNANVNSKSGDKTGNKLKSSKTKNKKKRIASASGNASVSNYPSKIVRKLRRSMRYPKAAKRKRIRGQVLVSFVVSKNGQASSIRLIRGSGSSILDKAAIATVKRAVPFPRIPNEARKSKWAFKVPLAFK